MTFIEEIFSTNSQGNLSVDYNNYIKYLHEQQPFIYVHSNTHKSRFFIYKGGYYTKECAEATLDREIAKIWVQARGEFISHNYANNVKGYMQYFRVHDITEFDKNPSIINVQNGLLNLDTEELIPHDCNHLSTQQWPVEYDPNAKSPKFKKYLKEWLPQEIDRKTVQQEFGYTLFHRNSHQKAFLWTGKGADGRGTIFRIIQGIMGPDNYTGITLKELSNDHSRVCLVGKRMMVCPEVSDALLQNVEFFKKLVGEDVFMVNPKYKDPFDYTNTAKPFFSCNELPTISENTKAVRRRWILTYWPADIKDNQVIIDLDKELLEKEASGIFNWMLEGYASLKYLGDFTYDSKPTNKWFAERDPIKKFLDTVFTKTPVFRGICNELTYQAYEIFCRENGYLPRNNANFKIGMGNLNIKYSQTHGVNYFRKLELKEEWINKLHTYYLNKRKTFPKQLTELLDSQEALDMDEILDVFESGSND